MIKKFENQMVSILTLMHDNICEIITGTFSFYHPISKQIFVSDFTIWQMDKGKPDIKIPLYSGDVLMLSERKVFVIMLNPKSLQKRIESIN